MEKWENQSSDFFSLLLDLYVEVQYALFIRIRKVEACKVYRYLPIASVQTPLIVDRHDSPCTTKQYNNWPHFQGVLKADKIETKEK